jgi:hypothetical protein
MLERQLKDIDKQFDLLIQTGLPEDTRIYLGMVGFKIVINVHGDVVRVEQPSAPDNEGEE